MKRITVVSMVAVVLFLVAFVIVRADTRGGDGWCAHGWHHSGPVSYLAHELKLSDAQRMQIRTLWQAEHPTVSGLLQEFAAENQEMDQATAKGNLDESKVQEIARRQGETLAKLLVEKEHFKTKIYATVLNPEQRTKADALQSRWDERFEHIIEGME